jgi:hypothetical protein
MTDYIDIKELKQEIVNWLRNSDIFTTTQRGVTTQTDRIDLSSETEVLINRTNVKNIRSISNFTETLVLTTTTASGYTWDIDGSGSASGLRKSYQQFLAGDDWNVSKIGFNITLAFVNEDGIRVNLYADNGSDEVDFTSVLATGTLTAANISGAGDYEIILDDPYTITSGSKYWVEFESINESGNDSYNLRGPNSNAYADGISAGFVNGILSYYGNARDIGVTIYDKETGSVAYYYGEDYNVDFTYDDSGTTKTKLTFNASVTGSYDIVYDYGTDKIYPDFPRPDLTINSFPRIGFDILNLTTEYGGFGNVLISNATAQIIVYAAKNSDIDDYISTIRKEIIDKLNDARNGTNYFYYFPRYVRPGFIGPSIKSPREEGKDKSN